MLDGLSFGWRTAVLTVAVVQLMVLSAALARIFANRTANRTLAALLTVMASIVMPWLIGFAGFYDKWMWLSFAPFQITLAVAPLGWLYLVALTEGAWPGNAGRHLAPAAFQFAYLGACFLFLPMPLKTEWAARSGLAYDLLTGLALVVQLGCYLAAGLRQLRCYRAALADNVADEQRYAVRWIGAALGALALLFAVWTGYLVTDLIAPLGYTGLMGLYLALAAVALFLGIEGWRHADRPFPRLGELALSTEPVNETRDWAALGRDWSERVRNEGWVRDPDLTLARLARRLGTNPGYLSRAINQGLGCNFSEFVAGLRADAVAERLRAGGAADLLAIALEEGFGSKASFNRAFAARHGMTPSTYRREVSNRE